MNEPMSNNIFLACLKKQSSLAKRLKSVIKVIYLSRSSFIPSILSFLLLIQWNNYRIDTILLSVICILVIKLYPFENICVSFKKCIIQSVSTSGQLITKLKIRIDYNTIGHFYLYDLCNFIITFDDSINILLILLLKICFYLQLTQT